MVHRLCDEPEGRGYPAGQLGVNDWRAKGNSKECRQCDPRHARQQRLCERVQVLRHNGSAGAVFQGHACAGNVG